ncbi:GAP family protein [Oceanobacillus sojae]|uniref:GAP family protein n=1 Tax=Oceanobacillus sojae TaxID=582851 RepID=UPI0021A8C47C|nr:GAP family protein [Oceanobacillus sojae]MCT1903590.1 GAP family protein [Oceanobacillus sojae]
MITLLPSLLILGLIDSTSFGTLLIPVWLLMTSKRVSVSRFLIYIVAVAISYFIIGLVILFGADTLLNSYDTLLESDSFLIGQLAAGSVLLVISQLMDTKKARYRAMERVSRGEGRFFKWRKQIMGDTSSGKSGIVFLMGLAVTAVVLEAATMLPYLAAIGLITSEGPAWPMSGILLAGYCIVMILPACILLISRLFAHKILEKPLLRLDKWLTKHAHSTTAWIIGIAGFLLVVNAINDLGLLD